MSPNEKRLQKVLRDEQSVNRLGIPVKYMCLSLMCEHHKSLHGELLDISEVMEIYKLESVPEDCRCGITQILMDETGNPRTPEIVEKAKSQARG